MLFSVSFPLIHLQKKKPHKPQSADKTWKILCSYEQNCVYVPEAWKGMLKISCKECFVNVKTFLSYMLFFSHETFLHVKSAAAAVEDRNKVGRRCLRVAKSNSISVFERMSNWVDVVDCAHNYGAIKMPISIFREWEDFTEKNE
jgi:hypothetical protein